MLYENNPDWIDDEYDFDDDYEYDDYPESDYDDYDHWYYPDNYQEYEELDDDLDW